MALPTSPTQADLGPLAGANGELLPIKFQEHVQLQSLGINAGSIGFNTLTMESDKWICVREKSADGAAQVVIIDLEDPDAIMKRPISADSAIMHPDKRIIALKAGKQLQVFNLENKQKLKSYLMGEEVLFWKWITPVTIGLVTETAVYHWNLEVGSAEAEAPRRVFERHSSLSGCQIINYRSDSSGRWLLLVGITAQQGRVVGAMQLYNVDRNVSQPIEGHCGVFAEFMMPDATPATGPTKVFAFAVRNQNAAKLNIVEIDHREGAPVYAKKTLDLFFPPEAANDFPVSMQFSAKYSLLYVVTKYGFIHLYDASTGSCIFMNRISSDTIFVTSEYRKTDGIVGVNRKGQVLSVSLDEQTIVPYLVNTLGNTDVAINYAARNGLPGAEKLFVDRFQSLLGSGQYNEAAKIAARSPRGILRTPETIEALKNGPFAQGEISPLLQYFGILLEGDGSLNRHESVELAKPVLTQGKKALLEKWLKESKVECSEDLGDIVRQFDVTLALSVYLRADIPAKVCECFAELGQFSKLLMYARKVSYQPDWTGLLERTLAVDQTKAGELAKALLEDGEIPLDLEATFNMFAEIGNVQQATYFILDKLKEDSADLGPLQTRLLALNLEHSSQVANAILEAEMFSQYDRNVIAGLCESTGLYQRAIEHYGQPADVIRVLSSVSEVDTDWLVGWAKRESVTGTALMDIISGLLDLDTSRFLGLVTKLAVRCPEKIAPISIIELYMDRDLKDALFLYLQAIVPTVQEPAVLMAYIQMAVQTAHWKELEKVCREGTGFEADSAIKYLKEANLEDPLPLVILCDRFGKVHDLILYLHERGAMRYIEVYVQKVNPGRAADVLGALLDVGCEEGRLQDLLVSIPFGGYSIAEVVDAAEQRNRLQIVLPLLEARIRAADASSESSDLHNALAKIYIDANRGAEEFLLQNRLYDPLLVGKYCEKRNPHLALIAYERGQCDKELIGLTNENGMFKQQARYLLSRKDMVLWSFVLEAGNTWRPQLIEQAIGSVIPECTDADQVSLAVKAMIAAGLQSELVILLERLLLEGTTFSSNKSLQNLLILTAIKAAPDRVSDFLGRLKNYDSHEVAKSAIASGLYEEAFMACKLAGRNADAVAVLMEHVKDPVRAAGFAELVNDKETWSRLALGQRTSGLIKESIESYLKAEDASDHVAVVRAAGEAGRYEELCRYLGMARSKIRDPSIESELVFAMAKTNRLAELETFVARPNLAQIQSVADRCYEHKLYAAARILFTSIANYARLATTLVHLREFQAAVDCAKKASNLRVWQEVLEACLEEGEFGLAQSCGTNLVVHADELDRLIKTYETRGHFAEAIALLEASIGLERAHMGIFTELAVLLAKYRPERLMDHLTLYWSRISIPKTIAACAEAHLWSALTFLYLHHDDHDRAVSVMLEHPADTWEHERLCKALAKVSSPDTLYRAVEWYHKEHPLLLPELLMMLASRLDPTRIVDMFRKLGQLALVKSYLVAIQPAAHITAVNVALNELLLEEEDATGLAASFDRSDRFDQQSWAERLRAHARQDIRRLAAKLYTMHSNYRQAIEVLLQEALYTEAVRTAAASSDPAIAESLLRHFCDALHDGTLFVGCLFACQDLLRPDLVLELAWSNGWTDLAMPYMCQSLRSLHEKQVKLEALLDVHSAAVSKPASAHPSMAPSAHATMTPAQIKSAKTSQPVTPRS